MSDGWCLDSDPGGDGVTNELTRADVTAVSIFQATIGVPGRVIPNDAEIEAAVLVGDAVIEFLKTLQVLPPGPERLSSTNTEERTTGRRGQNAQTIQTANQRFASHDHPRRWETGAVGGTV
jgi:hypothetical protein